MPHFPNQIIGSNIPSLQTAYWIKPDGDFHKIGQWPRPNSLRAETRYRNFEGQHDFPIATRYLVHIVATGGTSPTFFEDQDMWAWLDIDSGTSNNFEGETSPSPALPRCFVQINHTEMLEDLQVPGVQLFARWFNSRGFFTTSYEWSDQGGVKFKPDVNTDEKPADARNDVNSDYGYTDVEIEVYAVSECYDFPTEPSLIVAQASMNGTDAYISLDHNIGFDNGPLFFEADVRLRQTDWNPFLAPNTLSSQIAIFDEEGVYGAHRLELPDLPAFDVWFKYRFEFEWSSGLQLDYRAWIDDVLQDQFVSTRLSLTFDNIGVRRLLGTPVWGDFDIKNLLLKRGTFASPQVLLDMPMFGNALDLSPEQNHGTTHNMDLPST